MKNLCTAYIDYICPQRYYIINYTQQYVLGRFPEMIRKIMAAAMTLILCLGLCACGESVGGVPVQRADELIRSTLSGERYASRVVDVDVMFCDDEVICLPRLQVPHPLLHEREFALEPLCEIMADYRHPQLGRSLKDIYFELKEKR